MTRGQTQLWSHVREINLPQHGDMCFLSSCLMSTKIYCLIWAKKISYVRASCSIESWLIIELLLMTISTIIDCCYHYYWLLLALLLIAIINQLSILKNIINNRAWLRINYISIILFFLLLLLLQEKDKSESQRKTNVTLKLQ